MICMYCEKKLFVKCTYQKGRHSSTGQNIICANPLVCKGPIILEFIETGRGIVVKPKRKGKLGVERDLSASPLPGSS